MPNHTRNGLKVRSNKFNGVINPNLTHFWLKSGENYNSEHLLNLWRPVVLVTLSKFMELLLKKIQSDFDPPTNILEMPN